MKTSHLQSLIAQNANRITKLHTTHANFLNDAASFKNREHVAPMYRKHVEACRIAAFKAAAGITKDIAKAVELQKALQADLRLAREAEKPAKVSRFFTHVSGNFGNDAFCVEMKPDGEYVVHCKDGSSRTCNPVWTHRMWGLVEHTSRQYPVGLQKPGIYNIGKDGQPKQNGEYTVDYGDGLFDRVRYFEDGFWYTEKGRHKTGFGNYASDLNTESYVVK